LDESFSSLPRLGWVTFKSFKTWMSHFESLSSLSRLGWVTFKSLEDLDESLSSLSRLGWGLERRGTGSLSCSVDCCHSNQLDLLRVETRVCSYNLYATPFLSFPSHLTSVKFIKQKNPKCVKEKEREREKKKRENKVFFFEENELPPKKKMPC
jgi:hypothetical protein